MTECITKPIEFSRLSRKKVQADFNGGTLTSDAGALLLRVLDKRIGWVKAASVVTIMCAVCEIVIDPMEAAPLAGPAS